MTTPTPPEVREIAAKAIGSFIVTEFGDEEEWAGEILRSAADAVLSAVTPVIRQQERETVAEEIAQAIGEEAEFETRRIFPSSLAIDAFRDAAAVARSHAQPEERTDG